MLQFNPAWRFEPPPDSNFSHKTIPADAVKEFFGLIMKLSTQGNKKGILEHFKKHFGNAIGSAWYPSSDESWAESDLRYLMNEAADQNAPLFIEGFNDACEALRDNEGELWAPDPPFINKILDRHNIGYQIDPPNLLFRETTPSLVVVSQHPPSLAGKAKEMLQNCLGNSERLLSEGQGRAAVQEVLWLLETFSTSFRGIETSTGTIEGKYFNETAKDLRRLKSGTTFQQIVRWLENLYGYLSSPSGGGVRHGIDLNQGVELSLNEARLICNLLRSYLGFLISEHERLTHRGPTS